MVSAAAVFLDAALLVEAFLGAAFLAVAFFGAAFLAAVFLVTLDWFDDSELASLA